MDLIHFAIPGFILLITAEVIFSAVEKRDLYETKDAASSIAMGLGNVIVGLFTKAVIYLAYLAAYEFRLFTLDATLWWVWVLCFFADDLTYYWFHRKSHEIRYFWASHVVHHSSRRYNLSTALRQTWTGNLSGAFLFWIWMPLAGFHPAMIMAMQSISLLYQFWIHTEAINKLPRQLEFIFNTPSHHRVHHSSEIRYLDRNHGGVLIIWDRLFGTFQAEEDRPVYGLTVNIGTYNPLRIATHEWAAIWSDLRRARTWKEAWMYVFGAPGWDRDGNGKTAKALRRSAAGASVPPQGLPLIQK